MAKASDPIGIFDSGIGGLTVARAVKNLLPDESIIYFGDTAHLPYGDKSTAAIQAYSIKICDIFLQRNCKVILIACNSASAAATDLVKAYVGKKAKVFNVIEPVVNYIRETRRNTCIGLIGTKQTIGSKVYQTKIEGLENQLRLNSLATPLLVPMIEEGFLEGTISQDIINEYLKKPILQNISALILGCTHYPLIKEQVAHFYENTIEVIDSSEIVAKSLKAYLEYNLLINNQGHSSNQFMVSDYTKSFEELTKLFFVERVHLEKYKLWE
ncbi:MAG: glutamate racemase [Cytophagales bacterium]|nr:glutamate racemase [Cytophagales bacterium]